jgi:hypothetical protein
MMFGVSTFKMIAIGLAVMAALTAFAAYRASLIREGHQAAIEAVRKQDASAKAAADKVQLNVDQCYDRNWIWSVVIGACIDPNEVKKR